MKQHLNQWIWKWHFIGGLVSIPIVVLLSVTGIIYLFKDDYEQPIKEKLTAISPKGEKLTYEQQWQIAQAQWEKKPTAIALPSANANQATEFVSGRFSHKSSLFINPYNGEITGSIVQNKTDMHKVRKLHGELLMGKFGTKIVELIACWMVVLIISGIILFYPRDRGIKGLFTIRTHNKRLMYRDLHGLLGFWFSGLLLLILAGGLPWTDVWGTGFKWVQKQTHTGFPMEWIGVNIKSEPNGEPLSLDKVLLQAQKMDLTGHVSVGFPKSDKGVYSIYNQTSELSAMTMIHIDQYSGKVLYHGTWERIGILMRARLWAMAFHQGQFGLWNFLLVMLTAIGLIVLSMAGLVSYLKRKPQGDWGIPVSNQLPIGLGLIVVLVALGVLLPLFGASMLIILIVEIFKKQSSAKEYKMSNR